MREVKPKRIRLKQNTTEWLDWRRGGVGGSDANIIMGYYKKIPVPWNQNAKSKLYDIWQVKTGRKSEGKPNKFMNHGHETEAKARQLYCEIIGDFAPPACFERGFMRCSLDGWTGKRAMELKCPYFEKYHSMPGMVPAHYVPQVFHNLYVSGATEIDFVSYFEGDLTIATIQPQKEYLEELIEAETKFWRMVEANEWIEPKLLLKVEEDRT